LPFTDIVVVSGTNKMSYNCVNSSSLAQSKLFLRPSDREQQVWWYCENRSLDPGRRRILIAPSFETSIGGDELSANHVFAVVMCPFLRFENETTALGRMRLPSSDCWVGMAGAPAEDTKYAHMFLTDPPTSEVVCELVYRHSQIPSMMVKANRDVTSKTSRGLTFNEMFKLVREQHGVVYSREPSWSSNLFQSDRVTDSSIDHEIQKRVCKHGGHFVLDLSESAIRFPHDIIIPSAEEWMEMNAKRLRDEERSADRQTA
jgi:hypothetical protein